MKFLATAIATAALLSVGSTAAFAADSGSAVNLAAGTIGSCDALQGPPSDWNTTPLANKLSQDGVKFSSISTFGDCFSVSMTNAQGQNQIQLYNPTTLTRVL